MDNEHISDNKNDCLNPAGKQLKWFEKTHVLVMLMFALGPFSIPFIWISRRWSLRFKVTITSFLVVGSVIAFSIFFTASYYIIEYYKILQDILSS